MNNLKQHIQSDFVIALKSHDHLKVSTLRMLKAAILKWEVEGQRKEASNDDILSLIKKEIKTRSEAAFQYQAGKRMDLAQKEEEEARILQTYLPEPMSESEIEAIIRQKITEMKPQGHSDFGKIMGSVMNDLKGRADGRLVKAIVERVLSAS